MLSDIHKTERKKIRDFILGSVQITNYQLDLAVTANPPLQYTEFVDQQNFPKVC